MKTLALLLLLTASSACATDVATTRPFEAALLARAGFDTNPVGSGGAAEAVLGGRDSFTYAAGASLGTGWGGAAPAASLKLTYAGEAVRFDRWATENFRTHQLVGSGRVSAGAWTITGDGSMLFVDGSRETLVNLATANANAVALWRERRRQLQHRLKAQAEATFGEAVVRVGAKLLAYNYQTGVAAGKVAFADRSDAQVALDLGWKRSANSLWLAGVRAGRQEQAVVALPNCEFDYANTYTRLAAGWEGRPFAGTKVTFAAGPDFRRYTGAIDGRVFSGGRDRTSLWFEGGVVATLSPTVSVTGKATRMAWLSSTGKSAYIDTCGELTGAWVVSPKWTLRLPAKLHRCEYFPAVRDDAESFLGAGAMFAASRRVTLTADVLDHRAWNNLDGVSEREFHRVVVQIGGTLKF